MANQDNPVVAQVEELVKFCGKHKHVFIYDKNCEQMPSDNGVTSRSKTSLTSPESTPP